MVRLLIADNSVLVREGFKYLLSSLKDYEIYTVSEGKSLPETIKKYKPQLLVIDPVSLEINADSISKIRSQFGSLRILAITNRIPKEAISAYLNSGVTGFLLKDCDRDEICEAILSTHKGERFLCGKIADVLMGGSEMQPQPIHNKKASCEGLVVSEREVEIIKMIAQGLSNKQIADKLCLSLHTVNTHRKNILHKLKVNNTAGLLMFAVKNNLLADSLHAN